MDQGDHSEGAGETYNLSTESPEAVNTLNVWCEEKRGLMISPRFFT